MREKKVPANYRSSYSADTPLTITNTYQGEIPATKNGDLSETPCTLHWYAEAVLDYTINDYSNEGYTYKTKNALFPECRGMMEVQHFEDQYKAPSETLTQLNWRIPVIVDDDIKNGVLTIDFSQFSNWKPEKSSFSYITQPYFNRFLGYQFGENVPEDWPVFPYTANSDQPEFEWSDDDQFLTIHFGDMKEMAGYFISFSGLVEADESGSGMDRIYRGERFTLGADFTADYNCAVVEKIWENGPTEGRHASVQLYADGVPFEEEVSLPVDDSWIYLWDKIPFWNVDGEEILYTLQETSADERYTQSPAVYQFLEGHLHHFSITNTYHSPKINLSAVKVWQGHPTVTT